MIQKIKNWFKPVYLEWNEYQKMINQKAHLKFTTQTILKSANNHWNNIVRKFK